MAAPFSSSDEAIINTVVPLSQLTLSSTSQAQGVSVETLYDIPRVAALIRRNGFKRVALQFPDELLGDASNVYWTLEDALAAGQSSEGVTKTQQQSVELYVLADTSYGNCCVDEVAAEHVDADLVVHFGHACLSPTSRLPTIYVFHRLPIDVLQCSASLTQSVQEIRASSSEFVDKTIALAFDVGYEHAADELRAKLENGLGTNVVLSRTDKNVNWDRYINIKHGNTSQPAPTDDPADSPSRKNILPDNVALSDVLLLYIGPESLALTNLLLRAGPAAHVVRYDAQSQSCRTETGRTNKLLQRRYVAVQKARDAQTVGLLVGTLGLRCYLPLLQRLRDHLTQVQQKRVYTISVGKLNPAKLANFQEIDVFVLVACPENSLVDAGDGKYDSRDFFRPIVTPFELLAAFKGRAWTGEYVLDIEQVYAEAEQYTTANNNGQTDEQQSDDETPHFSLVTGGLVGHRHARRKSSDEMHVSGDRLQLAHREVHDANDGVVTVRGIDGTLTRVMDSAGAAHLATRSWRGLDQRLDMDEPAMLEVGRTGIAKGYTAGEDAKEEGDYMSKRK